MKRKLLLALPLAGIIALLSVSLAAVAVADDTPRISKEVLKALLGTSEIVVIDVRRGLDYDDSSSKIQGAVRQSEKDIAWADTYPKDAFLVLYCA